MKHNNNRLKKIGTYVIFVQ